MKKAITRTSVAALLATGLVVGLGGCGNSRNNSAWESDHFVLTATNAATRTAHKVSENVSVPEVDMASLSADRAPEGATLFANRCASCHRLDRDFIAPPLKGITEQHEPKWILTWILNTGMAPPRDPDASALFRSFITQMFDKSLDVHDAESILVFLREYDQGNIENPIKSVLFASPTISTEVPGTLESVRGDSSATTGTN